MRYVRYGVFCLCIWGASRAIAQEALDEADKSGRRWISLRLEAVQLESEWRTQCEVLASLVTALQERAKLTEEKRDFALAKTAQERQELEGLRAKNQSATEDLKACEMRLESLCQQLLSIRPKLPPHLSDALEMSYRSICAPNLASGERMQVAMNVLNRCAQFDRMISTSEDVLSLEGEPANRYFEVIYWGLSHAYAIDRTNRKAWLGTPGNDRWQWVPVPDVYDAVVKLIAVANDKAEPEFIPVPAPGIQPAIARPSS
jgi:hypothetical protein